MKVKVAAHGASGVELGLAPDAGGLIEHAVDIGSNELIFDYSEGFSAYDYWYGSMFLLLAENYIQLGEIFQAKATLQSILDQSTDATVNEKAASTLKSLN